MNTYANRTAPLTHESLYQFTPAEFRRLDACKGAIRAGYYNDGGAVTQWCFDLAYLRTGVES